MENEEAPRFRILEMLECGRTGVIEVHNGVNGWKVVGGWERERKGV